MKKFLLPFSIIGCLLIVMSCYYPITAITQSQEFKWPDDSLGYVQGILADTKIEYLVDDSGQVVYVPYEIEEKVLDSVSTMDTSNLDTEMPEFEGGEQAIFKYLGSNIKYPVIAKENGIQGTVIIQYVLLETGEIVNVKTVRSPHPVLSKEGMRVIAEMPKWKPGIKNGKPVKIHFTMPINFKLA